MIPNPPPPPGSSEAFAIGCTCPRMDNGHGRGSGQVGKEGEPYYWISGDCPIHARTVATVERQWDHAVGGPIHIVRPEE